MQQGCFLSFSCNFDEHWTIFHRFVFLCLCWDTSSDNNNYWSLTVTKGVQCFFYVHPEPLFTRVLKWIQYLKRGTIVCPLHHVFVINVKKTKKTNKQTREPLVLVYTRFDLTQFPPLKGAFWWCAKFKRQTHENCILHITITFHFVVAHILVWKWSWTDKFQQEYIHHMESPIE